MLEIIIRNKDNDKSYTICSIQTDGRDCLFVKAEDGEGMGMVTDKLYEWIDEGYKKDF